MRIIEPKIDEQILSSGWTTAIPLVAVGIAILMIVLGIIAIAFQSRGAGKVVWKAKI